MEFAQTKIILYMLIIANGIDFTWPWPIFMIKSSSNMDLKPKYIERSRSPRQIVQPKWLNFRTEPIIDPIVYVNPQNLREADMIRKSIQKAVEEDSYAVTGEETNPNLPTANSQPLPIFEPATEGYSTHAKNNPYALLPLYEQMRILWQNWSQDLLRGFRA